MGRIGVLSAKNMNTIDYSGLGAVGTQHFLGHRIGAIGLDASRNTYLKTTSILNQQLIGAFSGATVGSGITMSSSVTKAFGVYSDDGGAAIGSGHLTRTILGRHLLTYTAGNREQEAAGVVGQLVSSEGTNRHNMCGVMGSYEARTSLTIDGQIASTDTWCQAAVIGRVGGASMTIANYGVLAGVAAMSNITSGQLTNSAGGSYTAFYAGAWAGTTDWAYGLRVETSKVTTGIWLGTMTTGIDLDGTFSKGIDFAGVTLSAGSSYNLISFGDYTTGNVEVEITDYFFPVRFNIESIANPGSEKLAAMLYLKFVVSTEDQDYLDIQGIGTTVEIEYDVGYAHGVEGYINVTETLETHTGTLIGLKGSIEIASSKTVTLGDNGSAVLALIKGAGTYGTSKLSLFEARKEGATTIDYGLWVNVLTGATVTDGIHFGGAGTITHAMRFDSSACTVASFSSGHGGTKKSVRCDIDGTDYYLLLSTSPS